MGFKFEKLTSFQSIGSFRLTIFDFGQLATAFQSFSERPLRVRHVRNQRKYVINRQSYTQQRDVHLTVHYVHCVRTVIIGEKGIFIRINLANKSRGRGSHKGFGMIAEIL